MKQAPAAPAKYMLFSMARMLLILSEWELGQSTKIDSERLMLIDFAVQYPREICALVPEMRRVLEAESMTENDLSDLFAKRNFENIYERFSLIMSCLTARDLVEHVFPTKEDQSLSFVLTESGKQLAQKFSSSLSFSVRELAKFLIVAWQNGIDPIS